MTKTSLLRLVPEMKTPPIDLRARWNMVVGTPVMPTEPRQKLYDPNALHRQAKESWPFLMNAMYVACDAVGISRHSAVRAATKKLPRVFEKAMSEKAGNFSSILDFTRGKIITNNPETILALADHFRPMNNSRTRGFVDNFSRPDEDKMGLRRIKIITDLDNGHLAEIMVLHSGYDALGSELTHTAYKTVRRLEAEYGAVHSMPDNIRAQYEDAQQIRIETNQVLAQEFHLTDLEETRQYYLSDIPFMVVERPMGNLRTAVYPDAASGHYKIDNALLSLVGQSCCIEISREEFIKESMTHVHMTQKPYARPLQFVNE